MSTSTLVHSKSNLVTREQLAAIAIPQSTDTFKPIPHIELVETLEKALNGRDITVQREQFATNQSGTRLFGTMDLSLNGIHGSCASLGIRTANDRSMSLQMIAGLRIFVCDNLAFNGDMVAMNRKHTSGLHLLEELEAAVIKYENHYSNLKIEVENLKARLISDMEAKSMIHDIFVADSMPVRFYSEVSNEYFKPRHDDFLPRTAWSLHNAFTEISKAMPLSTRMASVQQVGRYFGLLGAKN